MKDNPEEDRKITDQELEYLRTSIGMEYICYIIYIWNSLKISVDCSVKHESSQTKVLIGIENV